MTQLQTAILHNEPTRTDRTVSQAAHEPKPVFQSLQFGAAALSVPSHVLDPPGAEKERRMATRIEASQNELDLYLTQNPQVWRNVIEAMPDGEAVRARWIFLTGNRMTPRGKSITVRKLLLAVDAGIAGDGDDLERFVRAFRLSPAFTHKLYAMSYGHDGALEALYARWRQAVNELAERFYRLAIKVINARQYGGQRNAELYSEAALALISAAERYQPELGRFSSFAHWLLETSVCNRHDKFWALKSDAEVEKVLEAEKRQAVGASETEAFLEQIEGQYQAAELLEELTSRERYIIENIFGLASGEQPCRSANELAQELHLSKGRVAQIKKAALTKMLTRAQQMDITPTGEVK